MDNKPCFATPEAVMACAMADDEAARKFPKYSDEVQLLIDLKSETVPASMLAPVVRMHPSVIVEYAKTGKWNLCKYVISGNRVKFFRRDFLQRMGFIPEDPPQKDLMGMILEELKAIREELVKLKSR